MKNLLTHTATRAGESGGDPPAGEEVFQHRFRVEEADLDGNGHANNAVYLRWMQEGQEAFFAHAGLPVELMRERGAAPIVAETRIHYKRPLYANDETTLEICLSEVAKASARVEFRFVNPNGEVAATGSQRGTFVDPRKPAGPPASGPEEQATMRSYLSRRLRVRRIVAAGSRPGSGARGAFLRSRPMPDDPKKIVLAYSGGLDTSVILPWLKGRYPGRQAGGLRRRAGAGR